MIVDNMCLIYKCVIMKNESYGFGDKCRVGSGECHILSETSCPVKYREKWCKNG